MLRDLPSLPEFPKTKVNSRHPLHGGHLTQNARMGLKLWQSPENADMGCKSKTPSSSSGMLFMDGRSLSRSLVNCRQPAAPPFALSSALRTVLARL